MPTPNRKLVNYEVANWNQIKRELLARYMILSDSYLLSTINNHAASANLSQLSHQGEESGHSYLD